MLYIHTYAQNVCTFFNKERSIVTNTQQKLSIDLNKATVGTIRNICCPQVVVSETATFCGDIKVTILLLVPSVGLLGHVSFFSLFFFVHYRPDLYSNKLFLEDCLSGKHKKLQNFSCLDREKGCHPSICSPLFVLTIIS